MYHEHGRREVHRAARGKTIQRGLYDVIVVKWEKRVLQYVTLYYILFDTNAARIYILS